jgi:uncharacterized membrane protein
MRFLVLFLVVVFTTFIGVLTAVDMVHNGVTWLNILATLIVVLFAVGIGGALVQRPRQ